LLCFDYQNGIIDEEGNPMFASESELFSIGTINLPKDAMNVVIVNTIQIKRITNTVDFVVEIRVNHRGSLDMVVKRQP
jgi:hypothetical protein